MQDPHCSVGYAAQSLLAALGSVQFVSNVIFASVFLKEKVSVWMSLDILVDTLTTLLEVESIG